MMNTPQREIGFVKLSKNYQNLKYLKTHHKKIDSKIQKKKIKKKKKKIFSFKKKKKFKPKNNK